MNQEQNNFNPNNFNTQNNNGIPNNQPLNNQSFNTPFNQNVAPNTNVNQTTFNQQPINSQLQQAHSFQQPVMQEPSPQPMNNTFESGIASNQNFNSKPPKKMNLGLIIGIVAAVVVVGVGIVFGSKLLSKNTNNSDNQNSNNNVESETNVSKKYSECAKVGNQCSEQEIFEEQLVNVSVNEKLSYDFYVISDDGTNLTLLKNGSLGNPVEWTSEYDIENVFLDTSGWPNNSYGPYTALTYLNELTKEWSNIDIIENYKFQNPRPYGDDEYIGLNIQNGTITLTSNNSINKIVPGDARARLMTLNEIEFINGINGDFADWLYNKLNEEYNSNTSSDAYEHIAYYYFWLLDSGDTSFRAGGVNSIHGTDQINVESKLMIYPVITVRKNKLN